MQGIFIDGRRPKSKKEIKETVRNRPDAVTIEATSMFGNEYGGVVTQMPENKTVFFVGPDPYSARNFYGQIERTRDDRLVVR